MKFAGAAAVGNLVVFAPYNADVVGVYDAIARTSGHSVSLSGLTMDNKFQGAAAAGNVVVFAPYNADA
eukprot:275081-Prymnesium_polylepis.1